MALLVLAFVVALGAPEAIRSDQAILDWYGESANQLRFVAAGMIGSLAILALLVFLVGVRRLLLRAGAPEALVDIAHVGGIALATLSLAGAAIGSSVAATLLFSDDFELEPDSARLVLTIGNIWIGAISGFPGGLLVGAASLASRRADYLPAWLDRTGYVLAVLSLVAYPSFGANAFVPALWILLVSVVLILRRGREPAVEPA